MRPPLRQQPALRQQSADIVTYYFGTHAHTCTRTHAHTHTRGPNQTNVASNYNNFGSAAATAAASASAAGVRFEIVYNFRNWAIRGFRARVHLRWRWRVVRYGRCSLQSMWPN